MQKKIKWYIIPVEYSYWKWYIIPGEYIDRQGYSTWGQKRAYPNYNACNLSMHDQVVVTECQFNSQVCGQAVYFGYMMGAYWLLQALPCLWLDYECLCMPSYWWQHWPTLQAKTSTAVVHLQFVRVSTVFICQLFRNGPNIN